MSKSLIPRYIKGFLKFYAFGVFVFSMLRAILFLINAGSSAQESVSTILQAFIIGFRFDTVVLAYLFLLPFTLASLNALVVRNWLSRFLTKFLIALLVPLAFIISIGDIPYYGHFSQRLSVAAFNWTESPDFVLGMVLQEPRYAAFLLVIVAVVFIYSLFYKRNIHWLTLSERPKRIPHYVIFIIMAGLIVLGGRGRLEQKSPIRVGTAFFSNNPFLNNLGLNANYSLMHSIDHNQQASFDSLNFMDAAEAVKYQQEQLQANPSGNYPLYRKLNNREQSNINVVLVLMEGMSAAKMTRHGNPKKLTPFLDSLSNEGIYFENAYSTGIHTFNGVYSTLTSFPSSFVHHPMKGVPLSLPSGLMRSFSDRDYSTAYVTTHDDQFDNIGGFLKANGCESITASKDYPSSAIKTTLGVPDGYMFQYSFEKLAEMSSDPNPFFCTYMTASDHGPYYIPDDFECRNEDEIDCIVEYADHSIRTFVETAKNQPWFDSTLFVFVADHGASISHIYEIPLAYTHIPILFYGPGVLDTAYTHKGMASQMDVFPTIMGLLDLEYQDFGMGYNLLKEKRQYSVFTADERLGVIDSSHILIRGVSRVPQLYNYRRQEKVPLNDSFPKKFEEMQLYANSIFQTYKECIRNVGK